ncbi:MAG TPA: MFS transporter, partial [Lachnospiraceae bacterium]|nr:MFS transporter [Lachnospiraceae bacterium]
PLYLLNQTGSAALFGIVSACSFIPMIILSPIGGIFADRVNKRNIMVILDFSTAALITVFTLLFGHVDVVFLILVTLVILYAIAGAYQPAVQASLPVLASETNLMPANAVINLVSSLAGLVGPVIGGALYGFYGLKPLLYIGIACFFVSAVMEIFIHIPFQKMPAEASIIKTVKGDLKESFRFIIKEHPALAKGVWIVAAINLFLSSLMIIGLPVIVTQVLGFAEQQGNQLYGYSQGALAAGSLLGGLLAGVLSQKLKVKSAYKLLFFSAAALIPMGVSLLLGAPAMTSYLIIVVCCFVMMVMASIFNILMLSYVQRVTPTHLVGKIISCIMAISMCASPLGQALYGWLFQAFEGYEYAIMLACAAVSTGIALYSRKAFHAVEE